MAVGAEQPVDVLIVDADPERAEAVRRGLERERDRFRVDAVPDGAGIVERIVAGEAGVDCLLLEHGTPDEGGTALVRRLREDRPDLPVVVYADREEAIAEAAIEAGASDVVGVDTVARRHAVLANRIENLVARRRAERATEATHQQYGRYLERPADYVLSLEADGTIEDATPSIREMLGYEPEAIVGTNVLEAVHPADRPDATEALADLRDAPGEEATVELRAHHRDGSTRWIEARGRNLMADPSVGAIVVNARDVTQHRTYTRTLTALQEASRELIAAADVDAVCDEVLSLARDVVDLPHAAVFMWDEAEGKLHRAAKDQELRDIVGTAPAFEPGEGLVGTVFETGEPVLLDDAQADDRALDDDRASGWVRAFMAVPLGEHGVMTAAAPEVGAFDRTDFEITNVLAANATIAFDQIDSQAELARQRDLFARAQLIARVGAWEYDASANALYWSEEVARIFDVPEDSGIEPTELLDQFHPEDRAVLREAFVRAVEDGEPFALELRIGGGKRVERWVTVRGDPTVEDGEVVRIRGTINDVSERKENERHLDLLDRLLRHNIRNEMTVIRGFAEFIRENADGPVREWAGEIMTQSDELLGSIEKEREIVKLLTGASNRRRIDVAARARRLVEAMRDRYPHATITVEAPDAVTATATGKFDLAVRELVENAVVHSDRDRPTVAVSVGREGPATVVEVTDDGPGIPDDDREPIQQGLDTHELYHGSGIGLWLVDWIVRRSDGSLRFEDRDPRGTVVRMELPRERSSGSASDGEGLIVDP